MGIENIAKATGLNKEIISLIQTEGVGFEVSISRNLKVGRTASEISTIKMSGHAPDKDGALQVLRDIDSATMKFIVDEGAFYGVDPKRAATTPSPVEKRVD